MAIWKKCPQSLLSGQVNKGGTKNVGSKKRGDVHIKCVGVGFVAKVEPINCTDIVLRLFVSKGIYKVGLSQT